MESSGASQVMSPIPPIPHTPKKRTCWNCGGDHLVPDCKKPRNEATIAANRTKFYKKTKKHKTGPDGKPLIRNKNGAYVLDQKKWKEHLAAVAAADATTANSQ